MMDIQSPTCFGPATALPRNSNTNPLTLAVHGNTNRTDSNQKYNTYNRSLSYSENMVVETQALNFGPMTPDPHPDNQLDDKSDMQKTELQKSHKHSLSLPPEGAMTPDSEPLAKRPRIHDSDLSTNGTVDYIGTQAMSNFPSSPSDMMKKEEETDYHANVNGVNYTDKQTKDILNSDDGFSQDSFKDQKDGDLFDVKGSQSLLAAFKMGFDKSPPTLSPKTMSDTDIDAMSTGSPSVSLSGERRKRKPKIEDIVRRMKEVETDYYSEDSDADDKMIPEDAADEVDGDISTIPAMPNQITDINTDKKDALTDDNAELFMQKYGSKGLNENNNVIDKVGAPNGTDENGEQKTDNNDNTDIDENKKGIPLPPSSSVSETLGPNGEPVFKAANQNTPPRIGSQWLHGAFGNFPFPFQASPPDLQFSNILSPFENRYSGPELEKDYLKCQFCERTFRRQKNLENHVENTHHGKSPVRKKPGENNGEMYFKCTHCPYTTKHQSNLYVHLRIHTEKASQKSLVCEKPGENNGEMYFKCTHCPYTTKHQSNLYVHLRIHTGERPYICGACGVQYSQSHSLKSHIINKHDGIMSYYIKEKRTRSPRGLGYLATHPISGESPVFKIPASPMMPSSMPQLPSNPNGLHPAQLSPQQQNVPPQHSPHAYPPGSNLHGNPGSVQHSPVLSPNHQRPQGQQASPHGPAQPQMSPQQAQHRLPFLPMSHLLPDGMDMAQKSLELAKLGLMNYPFYGKPFPGCKPSPPFPMNGHGPISPQYNGLTPHNMRQQQLKPEQQIPANGAQHLYQFHKTHNPLQEIHDNKIQDENGAIDLSKKNDDEVLDLALSEKEKILKKVDDSASCLNCLHLRKLKMLRMNVVRMLTILVPNLNFEEKGINAEGDSVDDLLRDVIESNIHEEDPE